MDNKKRALKNRRKKGIPMGTCLPQMVDNFFYLFEHFSSTAIYQLKILRKRYFVRQKMSDLTSNSLSMCKREKY